MTVQASSLSETSRIKGWMRIAQWIIKYIHHSSLLRVAAIVKTMTDSGMLVLL